MFGALGFVHRICNDEPSHVLHKINKMSTQLCIRDIMSTDLTKRAVDMLLHGASLLGQPCPYCSGVRVMKDGHALCTNCGREPQKRSMPAQGTGAAARSDLRTVLEDKMSVLSAELEKEKDHAKQLEILKSINSILEALDRLGSNARHGSH